ncbi:MAG: RNA-binding S4 domain-containing protein [Trueperella sp.]|nr:RNA-binding S4 domain-containing protein [Trueperella sp.]
MEDYPVRLPIRLGQFLKLSALAESGAHARELITEGLVLVNGVVETRRTHQLQAGDQVSLTLSGSPSYRVTEQ